jgi:hypothetical protein
MSEAGRVLKREKLRDGIDALESARRIIMSDYPNSRVPERLLPLLEWLQEQYDELP